MKKIILLPGVFDSPLQGTKLNEYQLAAIQELEGYHCLNSAAGSGKSTVLVARLQRIHELYPDATVLMLAFTKAAALELQTRVGNVSGVTISTLHSLSYHVIKSSGWKFTVESDAENQTALISELIGKRSKVTAPEVVKSLHNVSGVSKPVLRVRHKLLNYLKENHIVTFDTMPLFALSILKKHSGLRHSWQNRYDFVQVDEAQDLDPVQVALLHIITDVSKNLCVCGDNRQQIFAFRGACNAMAEFSKLAVNHELCYNYRCNPEILALANNIMKEYTPLVALSSAEPVPPQFWTAKDPDEEAKIVVDEILRLRDLGKSFKDIAVLYRSNSAASTIFNELLARKLPFQAKSPLLLKYNANPWRTIIRLLQFMDNPDSVDALKEILPVFFLKKDRVAEINAMIAEQKCSLMAALPLLTHKPFHHNYVAELATAVDAALSMSPARAIRHLIKHGLDRFFGETLTLIVENVISELQKFPTTAEFLYHVQTTREQLAKTKEMAATTDDLIQLMTIHTAKGCEWKNVFLIGCHEGCLPSSRADSNIDEERRLLYVAVTRAKERLYLSYPKLSDNSIEKNTPCRFLAGLF